MSASRGRRLLMADADAATEVADLEKLEAELKLILEKARHPHD